MTQFGHSFEADAGEEEARYRASLDRLKTHYGLPSFSFRELTEEEFLSGHNTVLAELPFKDLGGGVGGVVVHRFIVDSADGVTEVERSR